jgi:hypothetical protein
MTTDPILFRHRVKLWLCIYRWRLSGMRWPDAKVQVFVEETDVPI